MDRRNWLMRALYGTVGVVVADSARAKEGLFGTTPPVFTKDLQALILDSHKLREEMLSLPLKHPQIYLDLVKHCADEIFKFKRAVMAIRGKSFVSMSVAKPQMSGAFGSLPMQHNFRKQTEDIMNLPDPDLAILLAHTYYATPLLRDVVRSLWSTPEGGMMVEEHKLDQLKLLTRTTSPKFSMAVDDPKSFSLKNIASLAMSISDDIPIEMSLRYQLTRAKDPAFTYEYTPVDVYIDRRAYMVEVQGWVAAQAYEWNDKRVS